MTTYQDVFGEQTIAPSDNSFAEFTLTSNTQFYWPEVADGDYLVADIMELTATMALSIYLPSASQVSVGRQIRLYNVGAGTITVCDYMGGSITTLATGGAKDIYISNNDTPAGEWGAIITGGTTGGADASALAGPGLESYANKLQQKYGARLVTTTTTVDVITDRAKVLVFSNSGTITANLPDATTAAGFFFHLANLGTGSVVVDGYSSQLIDGTATKTLIPLESATFVCDGAQWISIGYGRSTEFQFTKLVKDITSGTPFTLTSAEASNKLLQFTGTLTGNVVVNVPAIVNVYYVENVYTGAYTVTIKTAAGTGVALSLNARAILYCDGVNVVSAQTSEMPTANIVGGAAGSLVYQIAPSSTGFTDVGASGQVLLSAGTGKPYWSSSFSGSAASVPIGGVIGLADNVASFLVTPSSANLRAALIDESGTGVVPFMTSGTWTPVIICQMGANHSYTIQSAAFTKIGRMCFVNVAFTITNQNGNTNPIAYWITLPITSSSGVGDMMGGFRDTTQGNFGFCYVGAAGNTANARIYQSSYSAIPYAMTLNYIVD